MRSVFLVYLCFFFAIPSLAQPVEDLRVKQSLNGLWDFLPILHESGSSHQSPGIIPQQGWLPEAIIVPGSWTRGMDIGEQPDPQTKPWEAWRLFDNYGYPAEWNNTHTAWYRRSFRVDALDPDRQYFIHMGGALRESWVFVNMRQVGHSINGIMPDEYNITSVLREGANTLHVYCTDYRRDEHGRTFTPTGADQMIRQRGLWQDVYLVSRPHMYVKDVTIRTSTRKNELTLLVDICNTSANERRVKPEFAVVDGDDQFLSFANPNISLKAGETKRLEITQPWSSYIAWSPNTPQLYQLRTRLVEGNNVIDLRRDRFGFREVWIDGQHIMLNGEPVHLFGEWAHKYTFENFRPEYIRQWFRMLKDCNMNYIRTHTFPHPQVLLDLADEMGILVSLESAWHFTHSQALDQSETWEHAEQHVREIIRRDKNHPSIILWSVANEARWGWNRNLTIQHMPRLRQLYEELDPTRIAYHDGDSSLWDEREQPIISRHYGFECTGEDWWDKSKPLHVGKVGKWHYGQPIDNVIWGDDQVFASFEECQRAMARECADMAEQARANGVACFFPWNLSGLDNWRPWKQERSFDWQDMSAPYVKPLRSAPYSSEFAWWDADSPGYVPGPSFDIIKHAFRPFALVVREKRNQVFGDQEIQHTITLVNDTGETVDARMHVAVTTDSDTDTLWQKVYDVFVEHGYTQQFQLKIPQFDVDELTRVDLDTRVFDRAREYDRVHRRLNIIPARARTVRLHGPTVAVFGDGSMTNFLQAHSIQYERVQALGDADPQNTPLLLIEKDAIQAETQQNLEVRDFVKDGGRVILLEQSNSIFPALEIDTKPVERVHIRGGQNGVLSAFSSELFQYWGDDPYGRINSDSWVVVKPYRKPAMGDNTIFMHSGYGDFGSGGLHWTPFFETRFGEGMALACQLRITEKIDAHPVALELLYEMLNYAAEWQPEETFPLAVVGETSPDYLETLGIKPVRMDNAPVLFSDAAQLTPDTCRELASQVGQGKTLIVQSVDSLAAHNLSAAFEISLQLVDLDTIYNLVRSDDDILMEGISHQETYWLDKAHYASPTAINRPITATLLRSPNAEDLLVSEYASAWREFFTLGAKSERLRMPVLTYYLWDGPREHASGFLRIRHGLGELLLCQIPFPEDYRRARVFWNQLFSNFHVKKSISLFDGDATRAGSRKSEGYPSTVRLLKNPSPELIEQVLSYSMPTEYRLPHQGLTAAFPWQQVKCPQGTLTLDAETQEALIFFQVDPGRPRVSKPADGEVPNPRQQTELLLKGTGRLQVFVNGQRYETLDLEKSATVADIDLHQYWNSVILHWYPSSRSLSLQWRNTQTQPEIEFEFR